MKNQGQIFKKLNEKPKPELWPCPNLSKMSSLSLWFIPTTILESI